MDAERERPRRADLRRGPPHPGDLGQPLHAGRARGPASRQVDELIDAARVPVFLLDEHQVVRPGEMGTRRTTSEAHAGRNGTRRATTSRWTSQFRCGGSRRVRAVGAAAARPRPAAARAVGPATTDFEVPLADVPQEMEEFAARPAGRRATAPGCPPATAGRGATREPETARPRPPTSSSATGPGRGTSRATAPSAAHRRARLWATDPAGFGQVGLRLHRAGLRVRLERRHHRPRPGLRDGRPLGRGPTSASKDPAFTSATSVTDDAGRG